MIQSSTNDDLHEVPDLLAVAVRIKSEVVEGDEPNNTDSETQSTTEGDIQSESKEWNHVTVSCSMENGMRIKKEDTESKEKPAESSAVSSKNKGLSEFDDDLSQLMVMLKETDENVKNESIISCFNSVVETANSCRQKSHFTTCQNAKTFLRTSYLAKNGNERPFSSTHCTDLLRMEESLNMCSSQKPFSCVQCTAGFSEKSSLKKHMLMHSHKRPFECRHCTASFKTKGILKTHLAVHSRRKPFLCAHCAAKFKTKGNLKGHMLAVHSTEKPVSCPNRHCVATFKTKSHLRNHLHVHLEKRQFSCAHCAAAFKTKSDLKRHLVMHSSEKPFACVYCPAAFKTRNLLKQHLVVHLNKDWEKKRFVCKCCAAMFETEKRLKSHVSQHSSMLRIHCFQRLCSDSSCTCVCMLCVGDR